MKNITTIFSNIILTILFLISLLIFYTENATSFDKKIIHNIESQLNSSLDVKSKIDSINIKWLGIKPRILIKNLNLTNNDNQIILETPLSQLEIDIIGSLKKGKFIIAKFTINDTSINLYHNNSKLSFNNFNLFGESSKSDNIDIPVIVFNNSKVQITNVITNASETFDIKNLLISIKNNLVGINAKFIHHSSTEPITVIFNGDTNKDGMKSKIYLSGNSIKLPYEILPQTIRQLDAERMSVRLWISMHRTSIKKVVGNISTENLKLKLNQNVLNVKNVNSDLLYLNKNTSSILSLMRMNYKIKDNKINNNKIVIQKNNNDDIKIFFKRSDTELLRLLNKQTSLKDIIPIKKIVNSDVTNLQIHLKKSYSIDYFSFSLKKLDLDYKNQYFATDVAMDIFGTLKRGMINIKNLNISDKNIFIRKLSGTVSYIGKGKSIYFSSSNFKNEQGHKISFTGNKVSSHPTLKIKVSTDLKKIINSTNFKKLDEYDTNAELQSNIYIYNGNFFTENKIKKLYFKTPDSIYISSKSIALFSASNLISTKVFNLSLNDQIQKSKINTNINSKSFQYILTSVGNINSNIFNKFLNTDKKTMDGETKFKSIISFDPYTKKTLLYSTSDLVGISLVTIKPWSKEKNKKVNFALNYQLFPKKSYPLKINLDKNEFEFKLDDNDTYIKTKSPAARGIIKYSFDENQKKTFSGSFEYIDIKYFSKDMPMDYFPTIDIQSKHVRTSDTIFDNVHLILTPKDGYIEISKLDFKNINIEMKSTGKWFVKDNQSTEIISNIKSDNFGAALKGIGYPNTIRGGKMNASIKSKWPGSLEEFSFASSDAKIKMKIKDGQINELDKGTQAIGQVLGLLSIASIPKRLSLDFSDFFSKGLSFDDLESEIVLNSGTADINKMIIKGSFGEMRLSGESNLVNRTHNQTLIFIPDLSSTSLVTGAVIGGPIGAAASIFYDKLLKEFGVDTNKLAGIEYSIRGSWDNPEIKVTQSFKPILN